MSNSGRETSGSENKDNGPSEPSGERDKVNADHDSGNKDNQNQQRDDRHVKIPLGVSICLSSLALLVSIIAICMVLDTSNHWPQAQSAQSTTLIVPENSVTVSPTTEPCPPGPKGETGEVGPAGPSGPVGPKGDLGATGSPGEKGAPGEKGMKGAPGIDGLRGERGPSGPPGPKGDQGDEGSTGQKGSTGPSGPPGPNGTQGSTGPIGPPGPDGMQGLNGTTGPPGPQGPMGETGSKGNVGPRGMAGRRGDNGETGQKGEPGPPGDPAGPLSASVSTLPEHIRGIRLRGESSLRRGRVEILLLGKWGTVCDDLFDGSDAKVACRQLGYSGEGAEVLTEYGGGQGEIFLSHLQCNGTEQALVDCPHNGVLGSYCEHHEDVGVICN